MGVEKKIIFKIGNEEYGLDIMLVSAIEKNRDIIPVPNSSSSIKGIINLRGDVIPVYDLRDKFGLPPKEADDNTKLIIVKLERGMLAFEVDSMQEIIEIEEKDIQEIPVIVQTLTTQYIDRVANVQGRLIILINVDGILSVEEKENIEDIITEHE